MVEFTYLFVPFTKNIALAVHIPLTIKKKKKQHTNFPFSQLGFQCIVCLQP